MEICPPHPEQTELLAVWKEWEALVAEKFPGETITSLVIKGVLNYEAGVIIQTGGILRNEIDRGDREP